MKTPVPWAHASPSPWQPAHEAYVMELAAGGLGQMNIFNTLFSIISSNQQLHVT